MRSKDPKPIAHQVPQRLGGLALRTLRNDLIENGTAYCNVEHHDQVFEYLKDQILGFTIRNVGSHFRVTLARTDVVKDLKEHERITP